MSTSGNLQLKLFAFTSLWVSLASFLLFFAFAFYNTTLIASLVKITLASMGFTLSLALITSYFIALPKPQKQVEPAETKTIVKTETIRKPLAVPHSSGTTGEIKETAILVSQIQFFNEIIKSLDAKELVNFLNDYSARMTTCIYATNGSVESITGDTITAIWGIKSSMGNPSKGAIDATLLMRESLSSFNLKRSSLGLPAITMSCGVAFGSLVLAQVANQKGPTLIGDTLNLANHLVTLPPVFKADIVVSEAAFKKVEVYYKAKELDKISLKNQSVTLYAIEGKKSDSLSLNKRQDRHNVFFKETLVNKTPQ